MTKYNKIGSVISTILPIPFFKGTPKKKTYLFVKTASINHINPIITSALNGATTKGL